MEQLYCAPCNLLHTKEKGKEAEVTQRRGEFFLTVPL